MPDSRAIDSLAAVARVLALAPRAGEDDLCRALAEEGAALLGARAAALVTLPAAAGADVDVALAGGPPRREPAVRYAAVAEFVASGATHRVVRNADITASGYDHVLLIALSGEAPVRVLTFADVAEDRIPHACAYGAAAAAALTHQAEVLAHRRAAERQSALARAAKTLNETSEYATLLGCICEEACAVVEADSTAIYRLTGEGALTIEVAHGLPPEHLGYTMPAGEGLAGKVLLEDRPLMTEDYGRVGAPSTGSPWAGVQASMAVPVHLGGRLRGVLSVAYWRRARLTAEDLETLATFAELAAVAFGNAHRQAGLEEAARTDPLTGCLNHAALHEGLAREIERAQRTPGTRLSLVLLDLDRFKEINDEHGHLVGDEVLRRVGHALRSTTRPYDLAARYGGDEFALVAIDADEDEAREIAERAIERITLALGDLPHEGGARATAGVAGWHAGLAAGDLIAAADRALLYGKRAARRGEVLTPGELPATFLPGRAAARDRRVPLAPPSAVLEWQPRTDDGAAERLRKRTRQLALANQLGARLAAMTDVDAIARAVVDELHEAFGYFLCAVVRIREDGRVDSAAGRGRAFVELGIQNWSQPVDHGLIGRCIRLREPVMTGDVYAEAGYEPTPETLAVRSELVVPLIVDGEVWGVINCEELRAEAFDADDVRLLATVAAQTGAALQTARLIGRLERAYHGTAEALAAALEAKDAYTADHARSIADLAEAVGRRLGMGEGELHDLRLAAVFHDIGKIAVPDWILNKPGPLDDEERAVMERHTIVGEQILAPVEFLAGVRPLVRHEHERWDGCGYPDGLAGDAIPLGARVILACDALHAMTSDRPYRTALPHDVAHEELRKHAGTQFDPRVVDALLTELGVPVTTG